MSMKFKTLKQGIFYTTQNGGCETCRYIIENESDLKAFTSKMPILKLLKENWLKHLSEGRIIIATELHPMTGQPTYCFESKDNSHPSNFVRIKTL